MVQFFHVSQGICKDSLKKQKNWKVLLKEIRDVEKIHHFFSTSEVFIVLRASLASGFRIEARGM